MFENRLKQLRSEKKITQANLAKELGLTQQAIGKWETGRSSPDPDTLLKLANYFGVTVDYLLGSPAESLGQVHLFPGGEMQTVPIIGTVRAGYNALAFEEDLGCEHAAVKDPENYFYLEVRGDSMEPRIREGDLALVRKQPTLDDGDLGVVIYGDGEGTLKRFLRKGNAVVLQAFNPAYDAIILANNDLEDLRIAGKVIETKSRW